MSSGLPDRELESKQTHSGDPVPWGNSRCLNPRTQAPAIRRGLLFRRHCRHTLIARAHLLRGGREIQRRAAFVGAAAGDHQPVGTGYDVTLAKRRVVLDVNRRETDLVLAVAGASRDQFVAIAKRIRQFGIRLSALGSGIIDIAAVDHFGLARRTKTAARCRPALAVRCRYRKIAPVAYAHAIGLPAA